MDVQINCPHCDGLLSLKKEWFGMGMNCPLCQEYFNTEAPEQEPAPQEPAQQQPAAQQPAAQQPAEQQPAQQQVANGGLRKKKMSVTKTGIRKKGGKKNFSTGTSNKISRSATATRTKKAQPVAEEAKTSDKTKTAAGLLCFFLGAYGVHRFYVGKVMSGLLMLFTLGGLGIWALIDFIMILTGSFKDSKNLPLK